MKTICLVMIVRNEAKVIERCLGSVRGVISHWIISDTGSTDGTQCLIAECLSGIPGSLHQTKWVDFGHNRSEVLAQARGKADYHLLIDADMTLKVSAEFRGNLTADSYLVRHEGSIEFWVDRVVSDKHAWRYIGTTHEYIHADTARTRAKLEQATITHHEDGGARTDKYERDILLLRRELASDPGNARSTFYLAQTYRDMGNLAQAMEWYEKRASMGSWEEERWYAEYQVARIQHRLGMAWPIVLSAYLAAYKSRPTRLEPLYYIARFYRELGEYALGCLFSRPVLETPYPEDILFLEKEIYTSGLAKEYAACREGMFGAENSAKPGEHIPDGA